MPQCDICDDNFESERGLRTHKGRMHDPLPKELAIDLYVREGLSAKQIATKLDMSHASVKNRLSEYDLWGLRSVSFRLMPNDGYPTISRTGVGGKERRVRVHRLIAIADGADPHHVFGGGFDIHHKNGVRWDNRPENIEVLEHADHASLHQN